jgi:hypothetical protein
MRLSGPLAKAMFDQVWAIWDQLEEKVVDLMTFFNNKTKGEHQKHGCEIG